MALTAKGEFSQTTKETLNRKERKGKDINNAKKRKQKGCNDVAS